MQETKSVEKLNKVVKTIERLIIKTLIGLMSLLLVLATIQLGYYVVKSILESNTFIMDLDVLMDLFGVFLLVLIGIELLDTIKVYFREQEIHVEVVILVALIAIARKIILLDFEKHDGVEVLGIAAIVITLALAYYFIKKAGGCGFYPSEKEINKDIEIQEKEFDPETKNKITEKKKVLKQKVSEDLVDMGTGTYKGSKDRVIEEKQKKTKPKTSRKNTEERNS